MWFELNHTCMLWMYLMTVDTLCSHGALSQNHQPFELLSVFWNPNHTHLRKKKMVWNLLQVKFVWKQFTWTYVENTWSFWSELLRMYCCKKFSTRFGIYCTCTLFNNKCITFVGSPRYVSRGITILKQYHSQLSINEVINFSSVIYLCCVFNSSKSVIAWMRVIMECKCEFLLAYCWWK